MTRKRHKPEQIIAKLRGVEAMLGELKKLGIRTISRSTVVNILKEHGLDLGA